MSASLASVGSVQLSVVVPVHNEATALQRFLPELKKKLERRAVHDWEIIVVDDASTDEIAAVVELAGVKLLRRSQRGGSGAARKTGSRAAAGERIVWIDGDGTYPAAALSSVLDGLDNAEQAIGVRSIDHGPLRLLRLAVKRSTAMAAGWLWKTSIPDLNSGLRAFRRESLHAWLSELPDGFSCTTTATLAALNHGQRVAFVPVEYRARGAKSHSKFHPLWDTLRLWRAVWRCWRRRAR